MGSFLEVLLNHTDANSTVKALQTLNDCCALALTLWLCHVTGPGVVQGRQGLEVKVWIQEVASHWHGTQLQTMSTSLTAWRKGQPQLGESHSSRWHLLPSPFVNWHVRDWTRVPARVRKWMVGWDHTPWLTSACLVFCSPSLRHLCPQQILLFLLTCQSM